MNFPCLSPGSVRNQELNRRCLLHHQCLIEFDGITGRIKEKASILSGYQIFQIESFSSFTSYAHFAIDQGSERKQTGIAAARQFSMMNHQTNLGP